MISKKILIFFVFYIFSIFFSQNIFGAINMTISPIKYEIVANTGSTITKEAKIRNNSDNIIHIITGKSDFVSSSDNGVPKFIRKSEVVFEQELSNWITIDKPEFYLAPGEEKAILFTINIPENATPGGHYGAVFFKNNNSEQSSGTNIGINIDYGVLILLKVNGEIITDIDIEDDNISINVGHSGHVKKMDICNETGGDFSGDYYDGKCGINPNINNGKNEDDNSQDNNKINNTELNDFQQKDSCFIDLTNSEYDGECFYDTKKIIDEITGKNNNDNNIKNINSDFLVDIKVPIDNKGNTHIKPTGKITLTDENGNIIKNVGKKIITNDKGAIIGEKIVDYIPFNDNGGNILPGTKRKFELEWKGFPYFTYNEDGEKVVKYWSPDEYYSLKNIQNHTFLFPWERICSSKEKQKIKAKFNIVYEDSDGENIEFNSAKEFDISYVKKYVGLNPYFFIILFILLSLLFLLFLLFKKKKKICINKKCKKKIDKDMKICPYCGEKQKIKKTKKRKSK